MCGGRGVGLWCYGVSLQVMMDEEEGKKLAARKKLTTPIAGDLGGGVQEVVAPHTVSYVYHSHNC